MSDHTVAFAKTASGLARSPLGIIALFIVLVYGLASMVLIFGSCIDQEDRHFIVIFLILFPVLITGIFCWLIARHSSKIFGPGDFKDEKNFLDYTKNQLLVAASLTAAASKEGTGSAVEIDRIVSTVSAVAARQAKINKERYILWVDDNPENNIYERKAFEAVGFNFSLALSTEEAIEKMRNRRFDAIISDMGRAEGPKEGYMLLDRIRSEGNETPLFIYAGSKSPQHQAELRRRGGQGCTNNGQELFEMVVKAMIAA